FDWGSGAVPFKYGGLSFSGLSSFAAASGLERAGLRIQKEVCFESFNVPGRPPTTIPPQFMTLTTGCTAVDAGTILPNINDGFVGLAPDLGAYEHGQPLPIYGPRPANTTLAPTASITPGTTVDFGSVSVGQSAERSFTVTNTGGGTLTGA